MLSVINKFQKLLSANNSVNDCDRLIEIVDEINGKSETWYNCGKGITGCKVSFARAGYIGFRSIFRNTNRIVERRGSRFCLETGTAADVARKNHGGGLCVTRRRAMPRHATPVTRCFRFHNRRLVVTGAKWHGSGRARLFQTRRAPIASLVAFVLRCADSMPARPTIIWETAKNPREQVEAVFPPRRFSRASSFSFATQIGATLSRYS